MKINNAGLVLLQSLLPSYFIKNRWLRPNLDLLKSNVCQYQAVLCLQYMTRSEDVGSGEDLSLNNLLCGLSAAEKHRKVNSITPEETQVVNDFLQTCMAYWPEEKTKSVEDFRKKWLVREGLLKECPNHWELLVTNRPNDKLLTQSPFSFSTIQFPWMPKPLHVTWPTT